MDVQDDSAELSDAEFWELMALISMHHSKANFRMAMLFYFWAVVVSILYVIEVWN